MPIGWNITAEIVVNDEHGALFQILNKVLNISGDGLLAQISVSLGLGHSWASLPRVSRFAVQGVLSVDSNDIGEMRGIRLADDVVLSRIGVLIYGVSVPTLGLNSKERMIYGFKVFGDMHIKTPGSVTPLDLEFEIGEFAGAAQLVAAVKGDLWKNAFGVGIDVGSVSCGRLEFR